MRALIDRRRIESLCRSRERAAVISRDFAQSEEEIFLPVKVLTIRKGAFLGFLRRGTICACARPAINYTR